MKISASSCWVWKKLVLLRLQQPEFDLLLSFFIIASNNKNKDAKKKKKKKKRKIFKPNQTQKNKKTKLANLRLATTSEQTKGYRTRRKFCTKGSQSLNIHCTVALQACQLERVLKRGQELCRTWG